MSGLPAENSFFIFSVRLRQLSSEISIYFYRLRRQRSSAEISTDIGKFLGRVKEWRLAATPISVQDAIVYHQATWLDYMTAKEKLSLARAAINLIVSGERPVPKDLRDLCLDAGLSIIETYTTMFFSRNVAFSRIYFHVLVSASVSCLYCILVECGEGIGLEVDGFDLCLGEESRARVLACLDLSIRALKEMASNLSDLKGYSAALEVVVSQMRSTRNMSGFEASQQNSGIPSAQVASTLEPYSDNMNPAQDQYSEWATQPIFDTHAWQSISTEMWQFVEPDWLDSSRDFGLLDTGTLSDMDWNDESRLSFMGMFS